jgi:hypothetical protein
MDEVHDNFHNHFDDEDEKLDFLEELINKLKDEVDYITYNRQ